MPFAWDRARGAHRKRIWQYAKKSAVEYREAQHHQLGRQAIRGYVEPINVAKMVSYLCTPRTSSITDLDRGAYSKPPSTPMN
jgi:hypothetical protein